MQWEPFNDRLTPKRPYKFIKDAEGPNLKIFDNSYIYIYIYVCVCVCVCVCVSVCAHVRV